MQNPERQTIFSEDRAYRYTLWRDWCCDQLTGCSDDLPHAGQYANFICLNPSTADETKDDPTIRRCIAFAKAWGYGAFCMTNLFSYRTKDPKVMKRIVEPVGAHNDRYIVASAQGAGIVVAAWGCDGGHRLQNAAVRRHLAGAGVRLHYLRITKAGHPEHPLYLPADLKPQPWIL